MVANYISTGNGTGTARDGAWRYPCARTRGFSLVELLVVMVIIISVTALSLPSLTGMVTTAKLRGGMGDLSGLFQTGRSQAVKKNKFKFVHFQTSSGHLVAYVDEAAPNSTGLVSSVTQLYLPAQFSQVPEPTGGAGEPTALDAAACGGGGLGAPNTIDDTYFNPMGIPCKFVSAGNCTTGTPFAYYFNYAGALGGTKWSALCVSPAGRLKSWYWNETGWSD